MNALFQKSTRRIALLFLLFICGIQLAWSQGIDYIKSHYRKREYEIAMRDGKKLFTAVYAPKDGSRTYPIMLTRTPYGVGPYGEDNYPGSLGPSAKFASDGFIFVYQDVRGRMMSEGAFINMTPEKDVKSVPQDVDESSDAYDTIDWLIQNIPHNNGRVGMWGISYPGFYAAAGLIDAHPALKAVSPQAPIMDWFIGDDFHHNGAFYLPHAFGFLASFGHPRLKPTSYYGAPFEFPTPDGYDFFLKTVGPLETINELYFKNDVPFWNDLMEHGTYDSFWQARNLRPHLKNVKPAVMTVGGWFDAEDLFGALNGYKSIEESSPRAFNILVMGPWYHGGWSRDDGDTLGSVQFDSKTSEFYREKIEYPFFEFFLKDAGKLDLPEAYVFETGTNQWKREDAWPPKQASPQSLYLRSGGRLSWDPSEVDSPDAFDQYVSDPARPVPYIDGIATGMTREHMIADQRFASRRTDVLVYESETLDRDITVAGPITPNLEVSTTGTDSDFIVKLIDVYPDDEPDNQPNPCNVKMGGYQQLVRGEAMRGRFRNSYEKPEPFVPGEVTKIEYKMPDIFHTFLKGHRVMVQIQSSWFPLVDRNPQQFVDIYRAKASDFIKATERVYRSKNASSYVTLNVIN